MPSDSRRSSNTDELARELNSITTEGENSYANRGSQRQLLHAGLSKYGSSVTMLRLDGPQKQQKPSREKSTPPEADLRHLNEKKESLAAKRGVARVDVHQLAQGPPSKRPTDLDHGQQRSSQTAKAEKLGHVYQVSMADIPRAG